MSINRRGGRCSSIKQTVVVDDDVSSMRREQQQEYECLPLFTLTSSSGDLIVRKHSVIHVRGSIIISGINTALKLITQDY